MRPIAHPNDITPTRTALRAKLPACTDDESEETVAHYTMGSGLEVFQLWTVGSGRREESLRPGRSVDVNPVSVRRDSVSLVGPGLARPSNGRRRGATLALTGADEARIAEGDRDTYRHDAWAPARSHALLASTGGTVNPHTYVGRERYFRIPNAAMHHLGFRHYAQGLGRFTTVDPARAGLNWGINTANRPTVFTDPSGLQYNSPHCRRRARTLNRTASKASADPHCHCEQLNTELYQWLHDCLKFALPPQRPKKPYTFPREPQRPRPSFGWLWAYRVWLFSCHPSGDPFAGVPPIVKDMFPVFPVYPDPRILPPQPIFGPPVPPAEPPPQEDGRQQPSQPRSSVPRVLPDYSWEIPEGNRPLIDLERGGKAIQRRGLPNLGPIDAEGSGAQESLNPHVGYYPGADQFMVTPVKEGHHVEQ